MFLRIEFSDDLAIYEQVVRQVKFAVADGAAKEGELVPSVRETARELAINPNTVARAFRQLQTNGVLESVRGTGLAVAKGAQPKCRAERVELIRGRLRQALLEAARSRLDARQLRGLVEDELAAVEKQCADHQPEAAESQRPDS